jgi:uncharacterized 2Fe-2S/4Fe-4S cluster protein (DUF4445 family)
MPQLTLLVRGERHVIDYEPGPSLRELLDATDFRVRSACHGLGACGLCRVRLVGSTVDALDAVGAFTPAEHLQIGAAGLAAGLRLACQIRPSGDATVELLDPAAPSDWRAPPPGLVSAVPPAPSFDRPLPTGSSHPLGVAVDLGTSHLTLAVYELASGRRLGLRFGRNPQGHHGADVVTRLVAAEDPATARQLAGEARVAIGAALADAAQREGFDTGRIARVVIVGNTAMLALLTDRNHGLLLQPAHWSDTLDCAPDDSAAWGRDWGLAPGAEVEVVPPLAGFVGSDLLAGLVASDFLGGPAPALLVDFGTNSEIALWTGEMLWVTAAAGGPAFETGTGRCGMPAEAGAVYRIVFDGPPGRQHPRQRRGAWPVRLGPGRSRRRPAPSRRADDAGQVRRWRRRLRLLRRRADARARLARCRCAAARQGRRRRRHRRAVRTGGRGARRPEARGGRRAVRPLSRRR